MKKFFKSLTALLFAIVAAVACFALAGCNKDGNGDNGGGNTEPADYVFIIQYKDGTKVNGQTGSKNGGKVNTGICKLDDGGTCYQLNTKGYYPDENGKLTLSQAQVNAVANSTEDFTKFTFHAYNVKDGKTNTDGLLDSEVEVNGKGTYTVTVD